MDYLDNLFQNTSNANNTAEISGTNIKQEKIDEVDLDALMADLNANNRTLQQSQDEQALAARQAAELADKKTREEARAKLLAEKAEKERIEREKIIAAQKAAEEEQAAELAAKQQANPLNKLTGLFTKQKKATTKVADNAENKTIEEPVINTSSNVCTKQNLEVESKQSTDKTPEIQDSQTTIPVTNSKIKKQFKTKNKNHNSSAIKQSTSSSVEKPDFEFLATHDSLTKLLNRTAFDMKINTVSADNLVIIFLDINNLKKTNDTLGHEYGNKLITVTAAKLTELCKYITYL